MTRLPILVALMLAAQAPLAWQAWEKSRQCEVSIAKQASVELGRLAAELDRVDCSFIVYYKAAWRQLVGD